MLDVDLPDALALMAGAARGAAWSYVVTPNAAHVARLARDDGAARRIYEEADFCFLDSRVLALAARGVGLSPPAVITGADLVAALFTTTITEADSLCLIGASEAAIAALRRRFRIGQVHRLNPSMGFWRDATESAGVVDFIVAAAADYTFLVVGSPQQEMLAHLVSAAGRARGVGICAGASIDFLTGAQLRAPRQLRRLGLEWAFRRLREPRRLTRRYLIESPQAVWLVLRHGLRAR